MAKVSEIQDRMVGAVRSAVESATVASGFACRHLDSSVSVNGEIRDGKYHVTAQFGCNYCGMTSKLFGTFELPEGGF